MVKDNKNEKKNENINENNVDNKVRKHRGKGSKELNNREKDILKFIEKQVEELGYAPSVREIGKAVGLNSTATVHAYLAKLEEKGFIKKETQKGRTLRLLKGMNKKSDTSEGNDKQFFTNLELYKLS